MRKSKSCCWNVVGLLLAAACTAGAATKPEDGSFRVVSWNVGHHAMGLKLRPTIPLGQDQVYLDMYKTFIGDARIVGVCEYSAEFSTNQPLMTAEALYGGYDVKIEGTRRGAQCNTLFMKGCTLIEKKEREYPNRSQPAETHKMLYRLRQLHNQFQKLWLLGGGPSHLNRHGGTWCTIRPLRQSRRSRQKEQKMALFGVEEV